MLSQDTKGNRPPASTTFSRLGRLLLTLLFGLALAHPAEAAQTFGAIAAQAQVDARGAAVYGIPLELPPGTGNVAPSLSLAYDSQAGDGVVGVGFSLQGLSVIRRCAATQALDGYNGTVLIDDKDRFCLDDQRLILVSGNYGEPGSVYQTALQSWNRVEAVGRCGSGPCSFRVRSEKGDEQLFGSTAQSRVPVVGKSEVFSWLLDRSSDRLGNYMVVQYREFLPSREIYPETVLYTANDAAGLVAGRAVRFNYLERPAGTFAQRFTSGLSFTESKLLDSIVTEVGGKAVTRYRLAYKSTGKPGRSLLESVEMCSGDGSLCLPPTTFTWQQADERVVPANGQSGGVLFNQWCTGEGAESNTADFNGDGRSDFTCRKGGSHYVLLSTGNGLRSPTSAPDGLVKTGWCSDGAVSWNDFNGDGRADVNCDTEAGNHSVLVSTGSALVSPNSNPSGLLKTNWCPAEAGGVSCSLEWRNYAATGRADALCDCSNGNHYALLSTGTSLVSASSQPDGLVLTQFCAGGENSWTDFNGDGRIDLVCRDVARATLSVRISSARGLLSPNSNAGGEVRSGWCVGSEDRLGFADFNGDFLSDFSCRSGNRDQMMLSTGATLVSPNSNADGTVQTQFCTSGTSFWNDFNGDGLVDLQCADNRGDHYVLVSSGVAVASPTSQPNGLILAGFCNPSSARNHFLDFNGDGLGDFGCSSTSGQQAVMVHVPVLANKLVKTTSGLGGTNEFTYGTLGLGQGDYFVQGTGAVYPLVDFAGPQPVVKQMVSTDGRGNSYVSTFKYQNARVDVERQVWLGFRSITRTLAAAGRSVESIYSQQFPAAGFVEAEITRDLSGRVWLENRFEPYIRQVAPNINFLATASERVLHYQDGQRAYSTLKRYDYDAWGNTVYEADLGDEDDKDDDSFTCTVFDNNSEAWLLGFERANKITRSDASCRAFLAEWPKVDWNPATDLRWGRIEYDSRLLVREQQAYDDVLKTFLGERFEYDPVGNATLLVDPAGQSWKTDYDETYRSFIVRTETPAGPYGPLIDFYRHDPAFGTEIWHQDPNGNDFVTTLDALGREVAQVGPPPTGGSAQVVLGTTEYGGDALHGYTVTERTRISWEDNETRNWGWKTSYYDGLGRVYREEERGYAEKPVIKDTEYNAAGLPYRQSFPYYPGETPAYIVTTYDLLDRPLDTTQPNGTLSKSQYLRGGLEVIETQAVGSADARVLVQRFDARENLLSTTAANGGVVSYRYDPLSQPYYRRNPVGVESTSTYDSLGRVRTQQDHDSGRQTFTYDDKGRLVLVVDAVGTRSTLEYDNLSRLVAQRSVPTTGEAEELVYSWDNPAHRNGKGELTTVTSRDYLAEYAYSPYAQPNHETVTVAGEKHVKESTFTPFGEVQGLTVDGGAASRQDYFANGSLRSVAYRQNAGENFATWAEILGYTAGGQPHGMDYKNGTETRYEYFPLKEKLGWLKSWSVAKKGEVANPANTLSQVDYGWNAVGQVNAVTELRAATRRTSTYSYDRTGWLEEARGHFGNARFAYDLAGNLTLKDGVSYRMAESSDRVVSGDNGLTIAYRDDGSIRSMERPGAAWVYTWNARGELQQVFENGRLMQTSLYDYLGRRTLRTDADGSASRYFFDEFETLKRPDGSHTGTFYLSAGEELVAAITVPLGGDTVAAATSAAARRFDMGSLLGRLTFLTTQVQAFGELALFTWRAPLGLLALGVVLLFGGLLRSYFEVWRRLPRGVRWRSGWFAACRTGRPAADGAFGAWHDLGRSRLAASSPWRPLVACCLIVLMVVLPVTQEVQADLGPGGGLPVPGVVFFHQNVVDSVSLTTGEAGEVRTTVGYLPFGEIDQPASSGPNDFRAKFTGQEHDQGTPLIYFGQRYYHPELGRFLSPDPEEQLVSPYTYGANSPLSTVDPDGELAFAAVAALIAIGVIGGVTTAYFAAAAVNDSYNPADWDWKSGKTWGALTAGAVIGAVSAVAGAAAWAAGPVAGIAADALLAGLENLFLTALTSSDPGELAASAAIGLVTGGVFAIGGLAVARGVSAAGRAGARSISRATAGGSHGASSGLARAESRALRRTASSCSICGCSSFPAGMLVGTESGPVAIEDIEVGAEVLGRLEEKADALPYAVTSLVGRDVTELWDVELEGEKISTTAEHPFWVVGRGWVPAAELQVGDQLLDAQSRMVPIVDLHRKEGDATVYNFEVASAHNYFVGESGVLVHNPSRQCGGVYVLVDKKGKVVRTGRAKNLKTRGQAHAREFRGYKFKVVFKTNDYQTQRGLEHFLYSDYWRTARFNKIRAIRDNNPRKTLYIRKAKGFLARKGLDRTDVRGQVALAIN